MQDTHDCYGQVLGQILEMFGRQHHGHRLRSLVHGSNGRCFASTDATYQSHSAVVGAWAVSSAAPGAMPASNRRVNRSVYMRESLSAHRSWTFLQRLCDVVMHMAQLSAQATHATHRTMDELRAGVDTIRQAPADRGTVALVVRRTEEGRREVLEEGYFNPAEGLAGDTWHVRRSRRTSDGSPHPDMQLTLMGVRAIGVICPDESRWPLAGDQLFVDLDLTCENVPPKTRLQVGEAVLEVTDQAHTGCAKFVERFGLAAMKWVNAPEGREMNLRGIYAKVVKAGRVRPGDTITKLQA